MFSIKKAHDQRVPEKGEDDMGQITGMDIGEIRTLATQMKAKAEEIRTIMNQLSTSINAAPWVGNDRDRFVDEWQSRHCSSLNAVITSLDGAADTATKNAADQEAVSNA
jgi:uncharacterized protein YukE